MRDILVVEDDVILNSGLCYNLELDGYKVTPAYSVESALDKLNEESYKLIILDVNLPDGNGFNLCKKIKEVQTIDVIFLTARDIEADVIEGYELGADDYITKPFNINIFRKKVAVMMKRKENQQNQHIYTCGELIIDFSRLTASVGEKEVFFSPTEYRILNVFTSNPELLLTRQILLEKLYDIDADFVEEHALTVIINRLRSKLETEGKKYIKTVYGMGYIWVGDKG